LAVNVDMDLAPFGRINPCGFEGLAMTQLAALGGPSDIAAVAAALVPKLHRSLENFCHG
jgi:lipoyl(octanoyl) transferase